MLANTLVVTLALALPSFVSAGLFQEGGPVKNVADAMFRKALKEEKTAVVAFVAPWCGHCQKLTPEFTKAAKSLSPLIDFYAVDCDADANKRLCAEQGVKGFPTIKSYPRGLKGAPHEYNGERSASSIVSWAGSEVPVRVASLKGADAVGKWAVKESSKPRALLLTTQPKVPVMWKVLAARLSKDVVFGASKDETGAIASSVGLDAAAEGTKSRVAVWAPGEEKPTLYDGKLKFEALTSFLGTLTSPGTVKDEL